MASGLAMTLQAAPAAPGTLSPGKPEDGSVTILAEPFVNRLRRSSEFVVIPLFALIASAVIFSLFLLTLGKSPLEFFSLIWRGGFGSAFSWQNTLTRAAPLILTALCVAIPARLGLAVVGGEGALVLSAFTGAAAAIPLIGHVSTPVLLLVMLATSVATGAVWIGLVGWMRHARGVNETISSLLMTYIAIAIMSFFIEGVLRDPADPTGLPPRRSAKKT